MKPQKPAISNHPILLLLEKCKNLISLHQIHSHMTTTGLILHTYPLSRILLLSSTLSLTYTLSIFNQIQNPSVFLFNTLISSFISTNQTHIAFSLYSQILTQKSLIKPNDFTYPSLFKACGFHPWLNYGRILHTHVLKFLEPPCDHFVQASLVNFYSKYGKLDLSRFLFNQISSPDLPTWNSILAAYTKANFSSNTSSNEDTSLSVEVLFLFNELQLAKIKPNEVTIVALITACADLGTLNQGLWAHTYLLRNNLRLNQFVGTALIDLYSKCGCLNLALQVFDKMPQRDTMCYNVMIRGFAIHGYGNQALELFKTMKQDGIRPDDVTLVVVMYACAHVGLVEEGYTCFYAMKSEHRIEPKVEHYGCLVDLLGRAGWLHEAKEIIQNMPMKPNAVIWRSLLGASRVHGQLEIGELALENLIELEPETSGNYVLLSNMYASVNRWEDAKKMRKMMKEKGANKMPGSSLIEIDGAIHEFLMGDKTHPCSKEIYMKLEDMNRDLQRNGYKPRIKDVLFDIEEEEKEDALSYHSERLAIAFALIVCDTNAPIRIIKNLRVCGDCHESTKLISKVYEREIIVRDRNRFHHFSNGICSCSDYW